MALEPPIFNPKGFRARARVRPRFWMALPEDYLDAELRDSTIPNDVHIILDIPLQPHACLRIPLKGRLQEIEGSFGTVTLTLLYERAVLICNQFVLNSDTADASDHVGAANAITAGLIAGHTKEKPGYWLHTGGTGILIFEDSDKNQYGDKCDKVYDDWENVDELLTLPDHAFHRNVDQIVLEAGTTHADVLRTALVCQPTIYGRGRGPCSQQGRQVYELANVTLRLQKGPIIGAGQSIWNNVHVRDLSDVYALLVDAAIAGRTDDGLWGAKAYYLTENGEHCWGELAKSTAEAATKLGYLPEAKAEPIDLESAKKYAGFESLRVSELGDKFSWSLVARS